MDMQTRNKVALNAIFDEALKQHNPAIDNITYEEYVKKSFKPAKLLSEEELMQITSKIS